MSKPVMAGIPETETALGRIGSVPVVGTPNILAEGDQAMNDSGGPRSVTVRRTWPAARDIRAIDLVAEDGRALPEAQAGAHINLHLPNGIVRQYSLMEPGPSPGTYRIAVLREPESRGGSAYAVETLREGACIAVTGPRNHFALDESATHYVLLAGGIGITPLVSMARRLVELGRSVELHYLVRERARAAFVNELESILPPDTLHLHVDDESDDAPDLAAIVGAPGDSRQVYVCGPAGLLDAIRETTADWPVGRVHFEQFSNPAAAGAAPAADTCEIKLRRSGISFDLDANETVLEALERHHIDVPSVCREGVCGTCAVDVVEGDIDHRDAVQDEEEKAQNDLMFVCCSRPLGPRLVLDL